MINIIVDIAHKQPYSKSSRDSITDVCLYQCNWCYLDDMCEATKSDTCIQETTMTINCVPFYPLTCLRISLRRVGLYYQAGPG